MKRTCSNCKKTLRTWELLCSQCATLPSTGPDHVILFAGSTLRYRIMDGLSAIVAVSAGVLLAMVLARFFRFVLSSLVNEDVGESVGTAIWMVTMFLAVIGLVAVIASGWQEVRSGKFYSISRRSVSYLNVTEKGLKEYTFALADVVSVQIDQNRLGRLFHWGRLIISTRENSKALIVDGIAQPYEFKKRLEDLRKIAVPKAVDALPSKRVSETAQQVPPRKRGPARMVTPAIVIVAIVALLAWIIMPPTINARPGESRDVSLEADYVLTHGDLGWTESDTQNLNIRVSAPDTVSVSIPSMRVVIDKVGEGQSVGFQYTARVQISHDASVGEAVIYIRITHPKLAGPSVSQPPVRKIRIRIIK